MRNVPSLILGSLATSDSVTLAVTHTERRSARMNRTSFRSAFWLDGRLLMIVPSNGASIR